MSESSPKKPGAAPGGKDDRRARQAEQLRENLLRRKEQARARENRENSAKRERGGSDGAGG